MARTIKLTKHAREGFQYEGVNATGTDRLIVPVTVSDAEGNFPQRMIVNLWGDVPTEDDPAGIPQSIGPDNFPMTPLIRKLLDQLNAAIDRQVSRYVNADGKPDADPAVSVRASAFDTAAHEEKIAETYEKRRSAALERRRGGERTETAQERRAALQAQNEEATEEAPE